MTQRLRLLNRRPSETFGFRWRGMDYTATTGRFPDGRLAEIFLSGGKINTDSDAIARDGGVVVSIALQFGRRGRDIARSASARQPRCCCQPVGRRAGSDRGDGRRQCRGRAMKITHPLSERGHDLYETPAEATHALLRAERLPQNLWEPACGPGAIVRVLRGAGHKVVGTDLVDYGSPDQDHGGWDFLLERKLPKLANGDNVEAIVTNPPFKLAGEFVEHALKLCPRVIMLLRLTFYESKRRNSILDGGQLARVHVFRNRLPMMHRANWDGPKVSNPTAFGWFVWHRDHSGPSTWDRISWTPTPDARPARATAQFEASLELPRQEMRTEVKRLLRGAR